ncbi:MAG: hypothetical protein ACR2LN_03485 [Candidatus Levyibacteriota bacterium]
MIDQQMLQRGFDFSSILTSIMIIGGALLIYFSDRQKKKTNRSSEK